MLILLAFEFFWLGQHVLEGRSYFTIYGILYCSASILADDRTTQRQRALHKIAAQLHHRCTSRTVICERKRSWIA
jgi:hypothetical protein